VPVAEQIGAEFEVLRHRHRREDAAAFRHQREAEQQCDELGAEPRERQRTPALDHQLDDVAREHEPQRTQHREVDGDQGVDGEGADRAGAARPPSRS